MTLKVRNSTFFLALNINLIYNMQPIGGIMKRNVYYFDYSPEAYNYIMTSRLLRQSEKNILNDIISGKTVRQLAIDYKCSEITICRKRKKIFDLTKTLM